MTKKSSETFKAQRWRELATQVEPPLYEKERITMFIETLQAPFMNMCSEVFLPISSILSLLEKELNMDSRVER